MDTGLRLARPAFNNKGSGLIDIKKIRKNQVVDKQPEPVVGGYGLNSVLVGPESTNDDPPSGAQMGDLLSAVEATKVNPDDLLIDAPNKPRKDRKAIKNNKKMAGTALAVQLLDSLVGATDLVRNQQEAVVAPNNLSGIGFTALNNINRENDRFATDLKEYNRRSEDIAMQNKAITQQANAQNKAVDVQLAEMRYNDAVNKANQSLEAKRLEQIQSDKQSNMAYEAALRFISNGQPEIALEYLQMAGLDVTEANELIRASGGSNSMELNDRDKVGIRRYYNLQDELLKLGNDVDSMNRREAIQSELKSLQDIFEDKLYAPRSQWEDSPQTQEGPRATAGNPNLPAHPNTFNVVAQDLQSYSDYKDMPQVGNTDQSRADYAMWMLDRVTKENSEDMQRAVFARMESDLQASGIPQQEIERIVQSYFGMGEQSPQNVAQVEGSSGSTTPQSAGYNDGSIQTEPISIETASHAEVARAFRNGDISLSEVQAKSPLLARQLGRNADAEPAPALIIKDILNSSSNAWKNSNNKPSPRSIHNERE